MCIDRGCAAELHRYVVYGLVDQIVLAPHIVPAYQRALAIYRDNLGVVPRNRTAGDTAAARSHGGDIDREAGTRDGSCVAHEIVQKCLRIGSVRRILTDKYSHRHGPVTT